MLIVQISDIHCGQMFNADSFRRAVEEINSLSPDLIVVTGDITEEGIRPQFQRAEAELKGLRAGRIVYLSGNHDYRSTGYLLFREFFPFNQVTEVGDAVLVVLSSARPDRDDGEVGHRQNLWLEETLSRYGGWVKIVAIHHHIIPVPDTGADQITIVDAGDVLRSLVRSGADLVLCGHRHRPWRWVIEDMQVIHAGSISCEKLRGFFHHSYNIIEIKDGKIDAKLKIVGGEYVDFNDIVKGRGVDRFGYHKGESGGNPSHDREAIK